MIVVFYADGKNVKESLLDARSFDVFGVFQQIVINDFCEHAMNCIGELGCWGAYFKASKGCDLLDERVSFRAGHPNIV